MTNLLDQLSITVAFSSLASLVQIDFIKKNFTGEV